MVQVDTETRSTRRKLERLSEMSISDLVEACRAESAQFLGGSKADGTYAMEVFRRAVCQRDEDAWTALLDMYRRWLLSQLKRHPCQAYVEDDPEVWINRTWTRFWTAVPAERFASFPDLASVLQYLKLCLHSVVMDVARANRRAPQESLEADEWQSAAAGSVEETVLGSMAGAELWNTIVSELSGEQEYIVAALSFVRGMKPNEVQAQWPRHFRDVAEVYRIKRNILDRLRHRLRQERRA